MMCSWYGDARRWRFCSFSPADVLGPESKHLSLFSESAKEFALDQTDCDMYVRCKYVVPCAADRGIVRWNAVTEKRFVTGLFMPEMEHAQPCHNVVGDGVQILQSSRD